MLSRNYHLQVLGIAHTKNHWRIRALRSYTIKSAELLSDSTSIACTKPLIRKAETETAPNYQPSPAASTSSSTKRKREKKFISIIHSYAEPSPSGSNSSARRLRQKKFISGIHNYACSPGTYKHKFFKRKLQTRRTQLYLARAKRAITSYKRKICSLRAVVLDLKKQNLMSEEAIQHLQNSYSNIPAAIMKRMISNTTNKSLTREKYPPVLRQFALTLQFYSSKAYEYVRKVFQLALPAQSTIRSWYSTIECGPGFCKPSFDVLIQKVKEAKESNKTVICSLMMDEIAIKRKIELVGTKVWGYVDLGFEIDNDEQAPATEALVIMVTSHNDRWKIPIAYFFIKSLTGKEKANIVIESLIRLHNAGIDVTSLTCDGPNAHFTMLTELGCKVNNVHELRAWFPHPSDDKVKVFVLLDACHMLKLVRNCLATLGTLKDPSGEPISWHYIDNLQKVQDKEGLRLANKLKRSHMDWTKQKMKVNLAAQTLSRSVADALTFLCVDMKAEGFVGAEATINFIAIINNLFDILNSRSPFARGFKAPMRSSNEETMRKELMSAAEYLSKCTDTNGKYLWQTNRKTPFIGFIITIHAVLGIYEQYVSTNKLSYLLTYKCSQDHLELFFCSIRSRNGWNNNPSCSQFMYSFKRLLMHNQIRGTGGNCEALDCTSILFCKGKSSTDMAAQPMDIALIKKYGLDIEEEVSMEHDYNVLPIDISITEYVNNVVSYISGYVVKMCSKRVKCDVCINALIDKDKASLGQQNLILIQRKDRGGLIIPSNDLRHVCQYCEFQIRKIMNFTDNKVPSEDSFVSTFILLLTNNLLQHNLFSSLREHNDETCPGEESHYVILIKNILFCYIKIRFYNLAKTYSERIQGSIVRKVLQKLILFNHQ